MSNIREYSQSKSTIEMFVYDGSKCVSHLIFYPAKGYYSPRYHFENFNLLLPELNREILHFMNFVQKVLSNPGLDVNRIIYNNDVDEFQLI